MLKLFTEVDGLREFVVSLNEILGSVEVRQDWLARINNVIEHIIAALDDWLIIATGKMRAHQQEKFTNSYLEHLPLSNSANYFYVYVKELGEPYAAHLRKNNHPKGRIYALTPQTRLDKLALNKDEVVITAVELGGEDHNNVYNIITECLLTEYSRPAQTIRSLK